jgi:3D (Asp-Asp-Asp) domain-containing protein
MTTSIERAPTILSAVTGAIKDGVSYLADLIARIVNGLKTIAPIAIGFGCQSGAVDAPVPPTPMPREMASPPEGVPADAGPTSLGEFNITFYYMIGEEEVVAKAAAKAAKAAKTVANDNQPVAPGGEGEVELVAITPPDMVTIYATNGGGSCEAIAEVSKDFAAALRLQGTGKLKDGRVVNIWGHCPCERTPCFKVTAATWGTSGTGRPLQPFRTVAVDHKVIKLGSLLYVPLLEGRTMPGRSPWGGFVHDGCVVADDTGGAIDGNQLDLFVGRKGYYLGISGSAGSHSWARHVPVFDGDKICERKGRHVARKAGAI